MVESTIPKVSVIIPTFNRSETIGRAIQSVLAQTLEDFEIIIVDDGSTDGTRMIVEGLWGPQFVYVCHERNRGAAAARNTGIRAARGRYLAFLDSDDEWLPDKLSKQVALLDDQSASIDLSCSSFILVSRDKELEYFQTSHPDWFKRLLLTCDLGPGSTLIVRKECIDEVGLLDERFNCFEDWDWLLRLSREHRMAIVEKPLARIYKGSLPRADMIEESMSLFLAKHDDNFRILGQYQRRRVIAKHFLELSYWFLREKRLLRGSYYLLKAFKHDPLQNPALMLGLFFAVIDAYFRTSIAPWALERKHAIQQALSKRCK